MGQRGPVPKSSNQRRIDGDPGKRGEKTKGLVLPAKAPPCPTMLSVEGRKEWRRVCKELLPLGLLSVLDRGTLAAYCEAWSEFVKAQEEVNKDGFKRILTSGKGGEYPNPALWVARDARKNLNQMADKLGMTPASRARLSISRDDDTEDEYEQYRKRSGENPFDEADPDDVLEDEPEEPIQDDEDISDDE